LPQLRRIVALGRLLDARGIIHGDAKLANLLSDASGRRIVFADFGFTGHRTPKPADYGPLQGFTRSQFRCPGRSEGRGKAARLVRLPPHNLWRRWNSIQLMLNLASHDIFLIPSSGFAKKTASKSMANRSRKRLSTSDIRRLFRIDRQTIDDLIDYCPGAADAFLPSSSSASSS
jgi:serine/threonine protein kinase